MKRILVVTLLAAFACSSSGGNDPQDVTDVQSGDSLDDLGAADVSQDTDASLLDFLDETTDAATDLRDATEVDAGTPWVELPLEASEGYLGRKAEYLQTCSDNNGPGSGSAYGQVCRVAMGQEVDEDAIKAGCDKLDAREDCADFRAAALVRLLYLDKETHVLSEDIKQRITTSLLNFKYWLDEPGVDQMCYWSENHQILYHSAELLVGQLFPEETFTNDGKTGLEHVDHAQPRALRWLDLRGRVGFSEWHSNVYFNEDIPALVNLADFAEDPEIRLKAQMVLDLLAFDMLSNTYKGLFATVHGRTYESKLIPKLSDSTNDALWIMVGIGETSSDDNFSAAFLATSPNYFTPSLLEAVAADSTESFEHRQRDGFDVADGPSLGISYQGLDDFIVWCGMAGLVAPQVAAGSIVVIEEYDLWGGFLLSQLPQDILSLIQGLSSNPDALTQLSQELQVVSQGIALETMNTYTYRTPHYQLSGAQDYNPGFWGTQTHIWQATLDREAFVFATFPSNLDAEMSQEFATDWVGSWIPRSTLYRNVGVFQYRHASVAMLDEYLTASYSHAHFPVEDFDEVQMGDHWNFGRKGEAYVALYSQVPVAISQENSFELIAPADANVWIVELGSSDESGTFQEFVDSFNTATVTVDESVSGTVTYVSPSVKTVEVGWEGPMTVDGQEVDLGPFPRWSNAYSATEYASPVTHIAFEGKTLELDFEGNARRLVVPAE